jgi:RNA polymerase sigma-70 factor, ECF subfamily
MSLPVAAVVREYAPFIWRVLRHLGVADSQIEDASQEVLLVLLRKLPEFEERSALRTFIYGICWNVAAQFRRSAGRREQLLPELPDSAVAARQDTELWLKQQHARLLEALDTLDDDQRTVFVLYEVEELSMDEIAQALGAPVTTCYSRLYAARERVRAQFRRGELRLQKTSGGAP